MTRHGDDRRWPYLSPARPGWRLVGGPRGQLRRAVTAERPLLRAADDPVRVVLDALTELERLLPALQQDVLLLVTEAHFRGASWREIAGRLDRSKQTVHQRFQAQMHARRTHEVLRDDVASAHRRARAILLHRAELTDRAPLANPDDVEESAAFLRGGVAAGARPAPAAPSVSGAGRG